MKQLNKAITLMHDSVYQSENNCKVVLNTESLILLREYLHELKTFRIEKLFRESIKVVTSKHGSYVESKDGSFGFRAPTEKEALDEARIYFIKTTHMGD